jgi:hypothetical protein
LAELFRPWERRHPTAVDGTVLLSAIDPAIISRLEAIIAIQATSVIV